jgi:hypothetical protein
MAWRNSHRIGDYLMLDDESGRVHYRSEMVEKWNGNWVRKDQFETRQPQEFVKAKADPFPLRHTRPAPVSDTPASVKTLFAGLTEDSDHPILRPKNGPAHHLYAPTSGAKVFSLLLDESGVYVVVTEGGTALATEFVSAVC